MLLQISAMNVQETHLNKSALNGDILSSRRIRATSLGIFWNGDRIFVAECHDPVKGETFYRPLGGGIEFGEYSQDTLVREMREETGMAVEDLFYLGTIEQIFTYNGELGHEIVMLYRGRSRTFQSTAANWPNVARPMALTSGRSGNAWMSLGVTHLYTLTAC